MDIGSLVIFGGISIPVIYDKPSERKKVMQGLRKLNILGRPDEAHAGECSDKLRAEVYECIGLIQQKTVSDATEAPVSACGVLDANTSEELHNWESFNDEVSEFDRLAINDKWQF